MLWASFAEMSFKELILCFSHTHQLYIFKGVQHGRRKRSHTKTPSVHNWAPPSKVQTGCKCSGTEVSYLVSHSTSGLGYMPCERQTLVWMWPYNGIQIVVQDLLAVLCSSARGSLKKKCSCLLISTKINISVISIRTSEDHYGSILRIEISALLARVHWLLSTSIQDYFC